MENGNLGTKTQSVKDYILDRENALLAAIVTITFINDGIPKDPVVVSGNIFRIKQKLLDKNVIRLVNDCSCIAIGIDYYPCGESGKIYTSRSLKTYSWILPKYAIEGYSKDMSGKGPISELSDMEAIEYREYIEIMSMIRMSDFDRIKEICNTVAGLKHDEENTTSTLRYLGNMIEDYMNVVNAKGAGGELL
jgi:hypothetical protein